MASVVLLSIQFALRSFQPNHSGFNILQSMTSPEGS
jgi:hypothetical protein